MLQKRLLVVVFAALSVVAPVSARAHADAVIDDVADQAFWSGGPLSGATAVVGVPESCAVLECDEFSIDLDLAPGAIDGGGLQVMIRWEHENDDLDLFVYGPDGELAAQSAGPYSRGEGVIIGDASNGVYRVVVVPVLAEGIGYEGMAEIEFDIDAAPRRALLPDLVSLPARALQIQTSAYLFDVPVPSMPGGCYAEEAIEQGARRCLRFDQVIANEGDGPFEVRYRIDGVATDETRDLTQRIYYSDGTWEDRYADTYEFHAAHAHFHYVNFAQSHLYYSNSAGDNLGLARSGRKNGFCMIDVEPAAWGQKGDSARAYIPPGCLMPTEADPDTGAISAISGISVGWADVYNWYLPDQFIEVTGLPDGYYILENIADASEAGTVLEKTKANNSVSVLIRLCGDHAEIVGGPPGCPA